MFWRDLLSTHGGRVAGVLAGVFFGIIYLIAGFWDMLFFALLVWIGYFAGKMKDERSWPAIPWDRLTEWLAGRWRRFR